MMHETGDAWYFCGSCGRSFLEKDKLLAHENDHTNNLIPVVQSYIDNAFKRSVIRPFRLAPSSSLLAMVAAAIEKRKANQGNQDSSSSVTPKGEYNCRLCDKVFADSDSYDQHCLTHRSDRSRSHKCLECGAEFKAKSYLQNHLRSSHSPLHTFECPNCSCRFEKDFGLRRHFLMYHDKDHATKTQNLGGGKGDSPILSKKNTIEKRIDSTEEVHKKKAAFTVKPKGSLVHREKILLKIKKDVLSGKSKKVNWTIKNKAISGSRPTNVGVTSSPYQCDICSKFLSTAMSLKFHMRVHTGEKPYPCGFCDARFRLSCTRLKHIKVVHAGTGTFQCTHCDSSYKRLGSLRMHIRTLHGDKLEDKVAPQESSEVVP